MDLYIAHYQTNFLTLTLAYVYVYASLAKPL